MTDADAVDRAEQGEVVDLAAIDRTLIGVAGGKGANLGELLRVDGVRVPPGFCVTTRAFTRVVAAAPEIDALLAELAGVGADDREGLAALAGGLRTAVEALPVPDDLAAAIGEALTALGPDTPVAVRSSATAEDLPTASFAGQQDSYLGVVGAEGVIDHVRRCWASLFTDRAVAYRSRQGMDQRAARMAVVVQTMVEARAAGVLFTADPVTGNRLVTAVEAVPGLGDVLVAGQVTPDTYRVCDGAIVTAERSAERREPAVSDAQVLELDALGRHLETHFGAPQDIEWCLDDAGIAVVQSRPITTLFPVPEVHDDATHVFVSVGHQQMMTEPMTPLGLSVWQLTAMRPMYVAGGRLFVDVAENLASPAIRPAIIGGLGKSDPLIGDALQTLVDREGFLPPPPADDGDPLPIPGAPGAPSMIDADPELVARLVERTEDSLAATAAAIADKTGPEVFAFILEDLPEMRSRLANPESLPVLLTSMEAAFWLNDHLEEWLGETNVVDLLSQSLTGNVTAEMGLALLDVADVVRAHPEVVAFLHGAGDDDTFLDRLPEVAGGAETADALRDYLERYGMRCVGEIDITRPRWSERPSTLVPLILANVENFTDGERERRVAEGLRVATEKEREVLERLRALSDGETKAAETKAMIDRVRVFAGYREYPKYRMISRYWIYKRSLLAEADRLVTAGVVDAPDDVSFLSFDEFAEAARTHEVDRDLIRRRREEFHSYATLTPPRVMTSEGEVVGGSYHRDDVPAGALAGLAVSAGVVEGRARVILDVGDAHDLEPGDILVTKGTDPSWSPVFVAVDALVTEVGGLMTHGAVIAREYGLPAVVGVEGATRLIEDGQRLRVDGTNGWVEVLDTA
ncbi:MAG: phosphoenolpyruvate synthase [Acidimicrobiales bacterium]|nr:phosphoenolpyruvate synthase [Acidimicrobiales bacterium]